ncbi:uncharacterized protein LOC129170721 [Dunckerocampus dactyliophorus]|uniref:uncharacterized protein LOC129170721 n=1 Tax=Dunckerocampus dactyliophorus TaxID=161453 RepID=UPI0024051EAF|nr:uncharacterized protein LOC129170721 [Dunckerocampus dactyliophorus]
MKTSIVFPLVLVQLLEAHADVTFKQLKENQSLELSCHRDDSGLTSLHLYHSRGHTQTTLLSMLPHGSGSDELRLDQKNKWRLRVSGGRNTSQVKVMLLHLKPADSGLYVCEHIYRENSSFTTQQLFLLVNDSGRNCQCSSDYPPLLLAIFSVTCFLLIVLVCLAVEKCVKTRRHPSAPAAVPVYEEMTRKQQHSEIILPNKQEVPSHLEEVTSPLYANAPIKQPQDNFYACPRHIALRA